MASDKKTRKVNLADRKILSPYGQNLAAAIASAGTDRASIEKVVKLGVKPGGKTGF